MMNKLLVLLILGVVLAVLRAMAVPHDLSSVFFYMPPQKRVIQTVATGHRLPSLARITPVYKPSCGHKIPITVKTSAKTPRWFLTTRRARRKLGCASAQCPS